VDDGAETLDRTTASLAVADRLRSDIQNGRAAPGSKLRMSDVAKRFGVSTTPVREAFKLLQAEGFLRIDPHHVAIVFHPTLEEMREVFEMRIVLEQLAISRAVPNITDDDLAELRDLIAQMERSEDPSEWRQLNTRFHMRIYGASGRARLVAAIRNLTDSTTGYSQMATLRAPRSWWNNRQHVELVDAIERRDEDRAKRILEEHLNLTVSFVVELFEGGDSPILASP
jgi:DNA-binding GntR family transcriptional regulator